MRKSSVREATLIIYKIRNRDKAKEKNGDRAWISKGRRSRGRKAIGRCSWCNRGSMIFTCAREISTSRSRGGPRLESFQDLVSYPVPSWTRYSDRPHGDFSISLTSFLVMTSVLAFPSALWAFQHLPRCAGDLSTIVDGRLYAVVIPCSTANRDVVENNG